jgi:hypothetical protein
LPGLSLLSVGRCPLLPSVFGVRCFPCTS